jgi:hypothetical protein
VGDLVVVGGVGDGLPEALELGGGDVFVAEEGEQEAFAGVADEAVEDVAL